MSQNLCVRFSKYVVFVFIWHNSTGGAVFLTAIFLSFFATFVVQKKVFLFRACVTHFYTPDFIKLYENTFPSRKYENKSSARELFALLEMFRT